MTTTINASTSSGLVTTPDNSGAIALQNNGVTGLNLTAAGYPLTPLRPVFDASGGGGTASGDLGSNCSWYANVNVGSNFSTSTGRFTAPVAGTYYFWSISVAQTDGVPSRTKLVKNNVAVYDINGGGPRQARNGTNVNTGFVAWVITLAVNDYVYLNTVATINAESAYLGFGGWLIG